MIPRNPVDTMAPTNEMNLKHLSSEIIVVKISSPDARFTDSNPPDCSISSKIFSIDVFEFISISFTERPGSIML